MRQAVLVSAVRTPVGKMGGVLRSASRMDLAIPVVLESLRRAKTEGAEVEENLFSFFPEARTPSRYVWLDAGLALEVAGLTITQGAATSLYGISLAGAFIRGGYGDIYVAGGVEMDSKPVRLVRSTKPYNAGGIVLRDKAKAPDAFGPVDELEIAEGIAKCFGITREEADAYALRSFTLAKKGYEEGLHQRSILPIQIPVKNADPFTVDRDETLIAATPELLKNATPLGATVTELNASPKNDGAAAAVMMDEELAKEKGLQPMLRFVDFTTASGDLAESGLAPAFALQKILKRNGMTVDDLGFVEVNEDYACNVLAVQRTVGIPDEKLNIRGGGIALGNPYTATGVSLAAKAAELFKLTGAERCAIAMNSTDGQGVAAIFENCN